jgi:hypothetical protein
MAVFWDVAPCSLADTGQYFQISLLPLSQALMMEAVSFEKTTISILVAMRTSNSNHIISDLHFNRSSQNEIQNFTQNLLETQLVLGLE